MRHSSAWAAGLVAAAVIGCGPGKELPDDVPRPPDPAVKPAARPVEVPAKSDPAAKAVVDRAIAAHTENQPGRTARGKVSRSVAEGTIKQPVDGGSRIAEPKTVRTFVAVWPEQLRVSFEYKTEVVGTDVLILRPPLVWSGRDGVQTPILSPQKAEEVMLTDGLAQHWLPLLFPLTDPASVLFDPQKNVGSPPADTVRLARPGRPVYQLGFDPATGHLIRVEYTHTDFQGTAVKVWTFSDHKAFGGVLLPTRLTSARTPERINIRDVVEQWTVTAWAFPETIDDAAFNPPPAK